MSVDNKDLEKILTGHSPTVISLVSELRRLVQTAAPNLTEEVKTGWGNITYTGNRVVCAISPHKGFVNIHFYQGIHLQDTANILAGSGKKLRHVKIRTPEDIDTAAISRLVQEAVKLDSA